MSNPVLVEVTRGEQVESRHRGAAAVSDAQGRLVWAVGEVDAPVFPRSAVKALQALPLLESGAADAFGFGARELALAQASHMGEPAHIEGVAGMLAAIGLSEADLECGAHRPYDAAATAELVRRGEAPSQLHNNCSGKHANFLAVARKIGVPHQGYVQAHHPVQQAVREALEGMTGVPHDSNRCGVDGCSIPTYAAPLASLARGFARFASGAGIAPARAAAARRLYEAAVSAPYFVAGTDRFDTLVMQLLQGAALVKGGAEGVHCAAVPGRGIGIALKCDDGSGRAPEATMAEILERLFPQHAESLRRWTHAAVLSRRGVAVGEVRSVAEVFAGLR